MQLYGGRTMNKSNADQRPVDWTPTETGIEESVRQLGLFGGRELYPQRPGTADCSYYMRTGSCEYGSKCRYNHPLERGSSSVKPFIVNMAVAAPVKIGEYPERVGEPVCQYYLRTGTCKFGASCKFHHPRHAGRSLINVPLNVYGHPLRPDEKECSYYLKTGQCKFGITCIFHHPQPTGTSVPATAQPFYPTVQSTSGPSPEHYGGASASYRVATPPLLPGSYMPSAYGPVVLPPGIVPIPNWSSYSGPVTPAFSAGAQHTIGAASLYGVTSSPPAFARPYTTPLPPSAGPSRSSQTEKVFPERPGQPECQYYMKTGDCKFGSSCKYHHPPDWAALRTNPVLSSGVQPCNFYLQNGHCKFGPSCKFDHPIPQVRYNNSPSPSSLTDIPVAPYVLASSISTFPPSTSIPQHRPEFISRSRINHSNLSTLPTTFSGSVGLIITQTGLSVPYSDVSKQNSSLNVSRSTRRGSSSYEPSLKRGSRIFTFF